MPAGLGVILLGIVVALFLSYGLGALLIVVGAVLWVVPALRT